MNLDSGQTWLKWQLFWGLWTSYLNIQNLTIKWDNVKWPVPWKCLIYGSNVLCTSSLSSLQYSLCGRYYSHLHFIDWWAELIGQWLCNCILPPNRAGAVNCFLWLRQGLSSCACCRCTMLWRELGLRNGSLTLRLIPAQLKYTGWE